MPPYREIDLLKGAGFRVWLICRIHTYGDPNPIARELQQGLNEYLRSHNFGFKAETRVEGNKIYVRKIRSWERV